MADLIEFPARETASDAPPGPGDPYRAYSRPGKKAVSMLTFWPADGPPWAFAYRDLCHIGFEDSGRSAGHTSVVLTFLGVGTVRLEGRNLHAFLKALSGRRIGWLCERPKGLDDAGDDARVVITAIAVTRAE